MQPSTRFQSLLSCLLLSVTACGGGKPAEAPAAEAAPPAPAPEAKAEAETAKAEPAAAPSGIPTACESEGAVCKMPKAFIERLCAGTYPNVALVLFGAGTPWTRGYLTRKTEAWNAEGGASKQGWLEFDEEVLLLSAKLPPKGGMQVTGMGGYQALRWDGSCVTLSTEEVTTRKPPSPKHPRIEWRWIEDATREALRKDAKLDAIAVAHKKECKGVSMGEVSKQCEVLDGKLVDAIVRVVQTDGCMPTPAKLP